MPEILSAPEIFETYVIVATFEELEMYEIPSPPAMPGTLEINGLVHNEGDNSQLSKRLRQR
ncbi:hypothetical protein BDD12DRAFT_895173 [Trichophaea hybrida]|nr:hypothetical protein BDD12DRAFT_895173 [Trichophaea hybrida]